MSDRFPVHRLLLVLGLIVLGLLAVLQVRSSPEEGARPIGAPGQGNEELGDKVRNAPSRPGVSRLTQGSTSSGAEDPPDLEPAIPGLGLWSS